MSRAGKSKTKGASSSRARQQNTPKPKTTTRRKAGNGENIAGSGELFRAIFESSTDGILLADTKKKRFVMGNAKISQMLGYSRDELNGLGLMDIHPQKDTPYVLEQFEKQAKGEIETASGIPVQRKDGSVFHAEISSAPINLNGATYVVGHFRDITERKNMEAELEKTAEKLRIVIESIGDMLIITDKNLNYTNVNEATVRMLGCKDREDLLGRNATEPVAEKDQQRVSRELKAALKKKSGIELIEFSLVSADGGEFEVDATVEILHDCADKVVGLVITARDVTERKRMQEILRASEEKLRIMFQSINDCIVVTDALGTIIDANEASSELTGFSRQELIGKNGLELIAPEYHQMAAETMAKVLEGDGGTASLECKFVAADGCQPDAEFSTSVLRDRDGNPTGFVSIARDITDRKRMQEEVRGTAERLRAMFDSVRDGIIVVDLLGNMQQVNEATLEMTGYSRDELIGKSALDFVAEEDRNKVIEDMSTTFEDKQLIKTPSYRLVRKDGSVFEAEMGTGMMLDSEGNVIGLVGVMRDVTERKQMQEELQQSEEKLRTMFESMRDAIVLTDVNGIILDVNEAMVHMHGYAGKEDILGRNGIELVAERDRDRVVEDAIQQSKGERPKELVEYHALLRADGAEFESESSRAILRDGFGNPVGFIAVERDITERNRMLEALRDSEEKKRLIFEALRDSVMVVDLKGDVMEANEACIRQLGYPREELIGLNTLQFVSEKDRDRAVENAIKLVSVGVADDYIDYSNLALLTKDGREVDVEHSTALMRDSTGKPMAVIGIARDITERKRMEKELLESAEKIRLMFDSIGDGITVTDLEGKMIETNAAAVRLHGFKNKDEMLERNGIELIAEKDRERCFENAMQAAKDGKIQERVEYTLLRNNGEEFDGDYTLAPMHGASGEIEGFIAIVRDITEQKRAQEALRASEEKLRIMFESIHDSIMITDLMGNIVDANEAAIRLSGYNREEIIGKNAMEFIVEEDRQRLVDIMMKNIESESGTENLECRFSLADGSIIDVESSSALQHDATGNVVGFVTVARDITERKRMQGQIDYMLEELKRSNAELEQFAYVASHDLQEPLRMISSYTQLLARRYRGKLDAEAEEFIEYATDGANRMQAMVQALLTYSRVGTRGRPFEPMDCENVLDDALKNLETALAENDAEVTRDPLPTVTADRVQLTQLFQNLIGNGIKFHDEKRPHVHVSAEEQGDKWIFSLRDNGIGIDPQFKERIFVIFQRLHSKGEYKGTGIGLAVCKKIVERHGGEIWVESEPGEGATFYFTIPKMRKEAGNGAGRQG